MGISEAGLTPGLFISDMQRPSRSLLAVFIIGIFGNPVSALAQQFVGGAFVLSWQPEGTVGTGNPSIPVNGIGGTGAGLGLIGGVFFTPRTAIEVELTIPSRFDGLQIADKFEEQNAHRDLIFSSLFRFRSARHGPEFVGGISYIHEDTLRQLAFRNFITGGFGQFEGSPESVIRDTWGLTGGLDFPIPLNSRIAIAPQLRVHWISRAGVGESGSATVGLSPVVWRPALAIIANF